MKKIITTVFMLCITLLLTSCKNNTTQNISADNTKLQVSVTFNALYEFASAVGQDKVQITTIIPAGTEPHDFEPKAADMKRLSDADVFVYNGFGMEAWADRAIKASENNNLTVIIASNGADPIKNEGEEEISEHGQYDPHLWLSLKGAEIEVQNIADGFSSADPENKNFYVINAKNYIDQLEKLYKEYDEKFLTMHNKNFVTGHAAFNYFCRDFKLKQNSVEDVFAEGEPSTKQLAKLVDYCKENHVTTIFAEDMASPEISQTLADEVDAKVETIHTIESAEENSATYIDRMRDNCQKIYDSLSIQK